MQLTTEQLERYIGGDFEVQNGMEDYLYRGPIRAARVENEYIILEFDWFAKNDGGPNSPTPTWTASEKTTYEASLTIYSASDIGQSRICLQSPITGELGVFFPLGNNLDPAKVARLTTA